MIFDDATKCATSARLCVERTGQPERGYRSEIISFQSLSKAAMDRVHHLHICCWFIQKPVSMDAVAAADNASWQDRECAYAWQRNLWWLVNIRDECGDFNERFQFAALPTSQTRLSSSKPIVRTPTHRVRGVQTFQRVLQCSSIT